MDPLLQENIEAILDASNEGIWDWSIGQGEIYYSESIFRFLGRAPEQRLDNLFTHPEGIIYQNDIKSFRVTLSKALEEPNEENLAIDCRALKLDGSVCWLRIRGFIIRDQGRVDRIVGTMIDTTVRRSKEVDLERKRSMLEMVVNNVPVFMYFKDRYSRYRIVNQKMVEWLGCGDMSEVIGMGDEAFYEKETAEEIRRDELDVIRTGVPIRDKIRRELRKGKPESFVKEVKNQWIDREGQVVGTFGAAADVSRLMMLQDQLRTVALDLQTKAKAYQEELVMARELQQAILPKNDGYWQQRVECLADHATLDSNYLSALELAGDYYELLPLAEGKLGVFICDVSGIGVRSAFIVSMIRGLIEKAMRSAENPSAFLERINIGLINLLGETIQKLPTSAYYAVIDYNKNMATMASAGGAMPIILDQTCEKMIHLPSRDEDHVCMLGRSADCTFSNHYQDLSDVGMLLFYTDGAENRTKNDGEVLGKEGLAQLAIKHAGANQPCVRIGKDILSLGAGLKDDVCLISLRSKEESNG